MLKIVVKSELPVQVRCYHNGELDILTDIFDPKCILLGRTGTGKTALLEMLRSSKDNVIRIEPEGLSLGYVSDSEILRFLIAAGVNMELFYRLLWRHVFAVEVLRLHYRIDSQEAQDGFFADIRNRFSRNPKKQETVEYLKNWGESFWLTSEHRVREVTQTLEKDISKAAGVKLNPSLPGAGEANLSISADYVNNLTEEQCIEVVKRGQEVVNKVQMRELSNVMDLMQDDLLDDRQKDYYIAIDRLDENWVHDEFRYHLIKALIDTARDFNNKIDRVKIIIAIREDLLARVFRYARSPGYQEEKYSSMYIELYWQQSWLEELLNKRVNLLVREQYTTQRVSLRDLFPTRIQKTDPLDYFFGRTLYRPRDAILFFNECIKEAVGRPKLTQAIIARAETNYSHDRLRSLADEWSADYKNLVELVLFLRNYPAQFSFRYLLENVEECMMEFLLREYEHDAIYHLIFGKFNDKDTEGFGIEMIRILFKVGVVGVKTSGYSGVLWAYNGRRLSGSEINQDIKIHVHPTFWRVLGIKS